MNENNKNDKQSDPINFLLNDFNRCFEQARYYDTQIINVFKFLAAFYTTIGGTTIGLYQFSIDKKIELTTALEVCLLIGLIFGISMFSLVVRNRVYFVSCMRYINEQREVFLSFKPLGFENKCGMYTDYSKPPYFNWISSQSLWMYIISLLNAFLSGIILYFTRQCLLTISIGVLLLFLLQLIIGIVYLKKREGKPIIDSVFK